MTHDVDNSAANSAISFVIKVCFLIVLAELVQYVLFAGNSYQRDNEISLRF